MKTPKWLLWLSLVAFGAGVNSGCITPNKNNFPKFVDKGIFKTLPEVEIRGLVRESESVELRYKYRFRAKYKSDTLVVCQLLLEAPEGQLRLISPKEIARDSFVKFSVRYLSEKKMSSEDFVDVTKKEKDFAEDNYIFSADGFVTGINSIEPMIGKKYLLSTEQPAEQVGESATTDKFHLYASIDDLISFVSTRKDSEAETRSLVQGYKIYTEYSVTNTSLSAEDKINFIRKYETLAQRFGVTDSGNVTDLYIRAASSSKELKDAKEFLEEAFLFAGGLASNKNIYLEKLADAYVQTAEKFLSHKNEVYMMLTLARGIYHELGTENSLLKIQKIDQLKKKLSEVQ